jgi:hypothetical protein
VRVNFETTHDMSYICTVSVVSTPDSPVIEAATTPRLEQPPRESTPPTDPSAKGHQERDQRRRRNTRDGRKNEPPQEDAALENKTSVSEIAREAEKAAKPIKKQAPRDNTPPPTDAAPADEHKKPKEPVPTNEDGSPLETPSASRRRRLRRRAGRRGGRDKETPEGGIIGNPSMGNEPSLVLDKHGPQGTAFPSTTIAATFDPKSPLYNEDANNPFDSQKEKTWWKRLLE